MHFFFLVWLNNTVKTSLPSSSGLSLSTVQYHPLTRCNRISSEVIATNDVNETDSANPCASFTPRDLVQHYQSNRIFSCLSPFICWHFIAVPRYKIKYTLIVSETLRISWYHLAGFTGRVGYFFTFMVRRVKHTQTETRNKIVTCLIIYPSWCMNSNSSLLWKNQNLRRLNGNVALVWSEHSQEMYRQVDIPVQSHARSHKTDTSCSIHTGVKVGLTLPLMP